MSNYKTDRDYKIINQYAGSLSVDRAIQNEGRQQLDNAFTNTERIKKYFAEQRALEQELITVLTACEENGITEHDLERIKVLEEKISNLELPQLNEMNAIQTQDIPTSFVDMTKSNQEFAAKYDIDLEKPFDSLFSNIEEAAISSELAERFSLLRLDKYDYAFASAVGIIGGVVDVLLIGTASTKRSECGKLVNLTDDAISKMVQKYAKLCDWDGPKNGSDPTKSAIGFLERKNKVNYDARYPQDIDFAIDGINPKNHHLLSLDHSPMGLIIGVIDLLQGKATFVDPEEGNIVRAMTGKAEGIDGIPSAIARWFGHLMSDVAGASGSSDRGAGIPTGMQSILRTFNVGKIPMGENGTSAIGKVVEKMYTEGFDFRFSVATAIPVIICEVLIRVYWFLKQHYYYGKEVKQSMPFGKIRELQRMLLISNFAFSSIDVTHALIKGATEQNPISFFNSVNYIGLADFGLKLFINFRLEHEHNKQTKELLQNDIRREYEKLLNDRYPFAD